MTDPRLIAMSSNPGQVEPGPLSEHDLREQWNAQAGEFNQWESLDTSEQLAWAQTRAIAADRFLPPVAKPTPVDLAALHDPDFSDGLTPSQHLDVLWGGPDPRVAATPAPEGPDADQAEGPNLADVDELCKEFGFHYADGETWVLGYNDTLEILQQVIAAAITRWRAPVAQPVARRALPPRVGHILRLTEIIREVGLRHDSKDMVFGAAALAEAILSHPDFSGCHDGPAALPASDHVNLIGFAFGREPWATWLRQGGCLESAHCELADLMLAVLAKWGRPAALPAQGELEELVEFLNGVADLQQHQCHADKLRRAAELLKGLPALPAQGFQIGPQEYIPDLRPASEAQGEVEGSPIPEHKVKPSSFSIWNGPKTIIRDSLGRRLDNVLYCDPQTGEVISYVTLDSKGRLRGDRHEIMPFRMGDLLQQREFYPAPLTIEIEPATHDHA